MSQLYTNLLSAVVIAIAIGTIFELWKQRNSLFRDELDDEVRSLVWRVVIFLVFPFIVWLDCRATLVATEYFGGWVKEWSYGFLWYSALPQNLPHVDSLLPVLFSGVLVQLLLAFCLLPSLFFRPHPVLATCITNTIALIFASNLIVDPIIGLLGAGSSRWQLCYSSVPKDVLVIILGLYAALSVSFLLCVRSKRVRIWFADLTSPVLAEQLRIAISEASIDRKNQFQSCRLAMLFERAGMRANATKELAHLKKIAADTLYVPFVEGLIQYRRRNYKQARSAFEAAAGVGEISDPLRATFLSAAACAAFAQGDTQGSINLSERALEFEDSSLVARMVKVDAYLRLGKKEQAGEEVLAALRQGLDFEIEDKVPLDAELTLRHIFRYQKDQATRARREAAAAANANTQEQEALV